MTGQLVICWRVSFKKCSQIIKQDLGGERMERFKTPSASMLILGRWNEGKLEILLQKRRNTGYMDGYYDFAASGHIEKNESAKAAMVREAKEELGIDIAKEDLQFSSVVHKNLVRDETSYFNFYFYTEKYLGVPHVNEPEKCSEIKWFPIDALPDNFIDDRRQAIKNHLDNVYYNEYGFTKEK